MSTTSDLPVSSPGGNEPPLKQQKTSGGDEEKVMHAQAKTGGDVGGGGEDKGAAMDDVQMGVEKSSGGIDAGAGGVGVGVAGGVEKGQSIPVTVGGDGGAGDTGGAAAASSSTTTASKGDVKRMWERHEAYVHSQRVLEKLPTLFPGHNTKESDDFMLWLVKLPLVMHRPRPVAAVHGWKAAGEILTVQHDEKLTMILKKMCDANVSCVPVLDSHRRYLGLLDNLCLVVHTLKAFGVMDATDKAASLREIALSTVSPSVLGASIQQSDAELKMEDPQAGAAALSPPVFVAGGSTSYAGRSRWVKGASKDEFGDRYDRRQFRDAHATDLLASLIPVLATSGTSGPQMVIGEVQLPTPSAEILASPLTQGHSTMAAVEMCARIGLHRMPLLNSERFVVGMITESMLISLVGQYKDKIPSFLAMQVSDLMTFLAPHRLIIIEENALAVEAFMTLVYQRVSGGAVVSQQGVLVDSFSTRDLRGIGTRGEDFENLWMTVSEFKQAARSKFPTETPWSAQWVSGKDKMSDVLTKMSDGNLHRVFCCELRNDKPHPIAVITQRDVLRMLLLFCGMTLQGEHRVMTA